MIVLRKVPVWRKTAEKLEISKRCLPIGPTRVNLFAVASPSNKLLVTNCQNRYPSPFRGFELFKFGPPNTFTTWHLIAYFFQNMKISFALPHKNRAKCGINQSIKGNRVCRIKFGWSLLQRLLPLQLAGKLRWNKDLWGQVPVRQLPSYLVEMLQPEQLLAVRLTYFIVSKIHHNVKLTTKYCATRRFRYKCGHQGLALVAVFGYSASEWCNSQITLRIA